MGLLQRYKRSVALKVLVPQILIIILSLIIVLIVAVLGINGLKKQTIDDEVKLIQTRMSTFINMRKTVLLVGASGLSKDSKITEALAQFSSKLSKPLCSAVSVMQRIERKGIRFT